MNLRAAVLALLPSIALAQQSIPLYKVTVVAKADSGVLLNINGIRALPGGRVIVNDGFRHRLLMFDSTLARFTIIADTARGAPNRYGTQYNLLLPYLADSSVFVDREAQAFVVIDPAGKFVRTMAPPNLRDLSRLTASSGFDPKGRLYYRTDRQLPARSMSSSNPDPSARPVVASRPDSATIVRGDMDRRAVDTVTTMHIPVMKMVTVAGPNGLGMGTVAINPFPDTDDWALLPDGTIAIVRGHDYHIDWVRPDGSKTSTPKMPFDWKRLTLEDKQQALDSIKRAHDAQVAKQPRSPADGPAPPFATVEPSDLPDYVPPIKLGQTKVDRDGNLWILPATSTLTTGGLVFDVVNRKGEIFERVQLPVGRNLAGFGPNGAVYLSAPVANGWVRLERAALGR